MKNKKFFALAATCMLSASLLLAGCSNSDSASDAVATDGTYTASATGIASDVSVTIVVENGAITDCTIDASGETEGLGTLVPEQLESVIVENQGVNVDAVSGATITSDAALTALADCMSQAGLAE